ncbi:putative membrane protein [Corynebacterium simulans]|nr:putative membrane protein [Corynebacterium simulans]
MLCDFGWGLRFWRLGSGFGAAAADVGGLGVVGVGGVRRT